MQYCTYQFYQEEYGGTSITSEAGFKHNEVKARALIDRITFGRLKKAGFKTVDDVPEEVRYAVCAAAEYSSQAEASGGRTVASETTGKHSVSYGDADLSVEAGMMRCAMQFLSGSLWTYRGVYCCERHRHSHCPKCDQG